MNTPPIKKDGTIYNGNVFADGVLYPFSIKYTGESECGDGSLFYIEFLLIKQLFLEEDLEEFFTNTVYDCVEDWNEYQAEVAKKRKSITLRVPQGDLSKIKALADQEGLPYQTFLTSQIHKIAQSSM